MTPRSKLSSKLDERRQAKQVRKGGDRTLLVVSALDLRGRDISADVSDIRGIGNDVVWFEIGLDVVA